MALDENESLIAELQEKYSAPQDQARALARLFHHSSECLSFIERPDERKNAFTSPWKGVPEISGVWLCSSKFGLLVAGMIPSQVGALTESSFLCRIFFKEVSAILLLGSLRAEWMGVPSTGRTGIPHRYRGTPFPS